LARVFVAFFAIEPWIAEFPLIWRILPIGTVAALHHDEMASR
jgi:hypothetical protein